MPRIYYNEHDPFAAAWLHNLIAAGVIAPGDVDDRSIEDVRPQDLEGYTQCHFFAGIGVWSYALRRGGWSDSRPVWTGSCPCQPYSAAGQGAGFADERHLWPAWFHLIDVCRPAVIFGEQVAAKAALPWLDLVQTDLEGANYAVGPLDLCAAGVGAPNLRQRLYFVADTHGVVSRQGSADDRRGNPGGVAESWPRSRGCQLSSELVDADGADSQQLTRQGAGSEGSPSSRSYRQLDGSGDVSQLADADGGHPGAEGLQRSRQHGQRPQDASLGDGTGWAGPLNGFWRDADWLRCRDGRWRPVEPGTFPLVTGAPARVGRLRGYGNAINAEVAAEFVRAYLEVRG